MTKKKISIFALALFFIVLQGFGQITVESERDSKGDVYIFAENLDPIPYTVTVTFKDLRNLISNGGSVVTKVVLPGKTQVAMLKKEMASKSVSSYHYSYTYNKGNINAKWKENLVYLPPVKNGIEVEAIPMTHIENTIRNDQVNNDYVGLAFLFFKPTIVCAPRKGVVSEIKIEEDIKGHSLHFSANDNYIEIYHEDGVFSKIKVLNPGTAKVKIGDIVYPGDPIAESAGEKYSTGPHVRMVQSKLVKIDNEIKRVNIEVLINGSNNLPIKVKDRTKILVSHPEKLILEEMSKREKKKYNSK